MFDNDSAEYFTDMSTIDLTKEGEYEIEIQVINYLAYKSKLVVQDTIKPEVVTKDLSVGFESKLTPEDFVVSAKDHSEFKHEFKSPIDYKKAEQEIIIVTTDTADNRTETPAKLSLYQIKTTIKQELGETSKLVPQDFLSNLDLDINIEFVTDSKTIENLKVGTHQIKLLVDKKPATASVEVVDTTAPTATAASPTFYKDYAMSIEDFIVEYFDLSEVTLKYKDDKAPVLTKSGVFSQVIVVEDIYGNKTEVTANYTVEIDEEKPVISGAVDFEIIIGEPFNIRGSAYVTDNMDRTIQLVVDSSKVKTDTEGTYPLVYKATDKSKNSTQTEIKVKVRKRLPYQPLGDTGNAQLNSMVDKILSSIIHGFKNRDFNYGVSVYTEEKIDLENSKIFYQIENQWYQSQIKF